MTPLRLAFLAALGFSLLIAVWRPGDAGGIVAALEGWTLDARFQARGERTPPEDIAILAIDDAALATLDAFPPPRDALANALTAARQAGARVVAFDLLLTGAGQGDTALREALRQTEGDILAVSLSRAVETPHGISLDSALARSALALVIGAPQNTQNGVLGPALVFAEQAALAHVNVARETDGALRRAPVAHAAASGLVLPALPLEAVRQHKALARADLELDWGKTLRIGARKITLTRDNEVGLNFYGPRGSIPTYSLINAETVPLAGHTVFIGATAEGFGDTFATPFDRDLPGVEVLATMTANLFDESTLRRDDVTWGFDVLLAVMAALASVWAASRARPIRAVLLMLCVWATVCAIVQIAFLRGIWLDGATPLLAMLVATGAGGSARWVLHQRSAANLARYQSPLLSGVLAERNRPDFDGRVQKAAALFVDAADFTARSARLGPSRTTDFLKAFHHCVERAALAHGGIVEQYAGDGAMICFGLPEPSPHDARNALRCARQLFAETEALSDAERAAGEQPVSIRIGLHYGDVAAAVLGGQDHGHVTFVGDVINHASRLQEVAKTLGAALVVSDTLLEAAGDGEREDLLLYGEHPIRGSETPLKIWTSPRRALSTEETPVDHPFG